jgi:hypothetical protein
MNSNTKSLLLKVSLSLMVVLSLALIGRLFIFSDIRQKADDNAYREAFNRNYKIFAAEIPETLDFAGENVPLDKYWVREALDRELMVNMYWHSNTLLCIKRAFRFFPIIEPILKAEGVPDDLKYLALIESNLTQTISPAGASGFWQFMRTTGLKYNLTINENIDERYHIEKSTVADCRLLKDLHRSYRSWASAAAAYNMGPGGLNNQTGLQQEKSYYDLLLNAETSRYVYRILAMKLIMSKPTAYGFFLRRCDLYLPIPTYTVPVDTTIGNLADFARTNGVSYRTLKEFNPWLRERTLQNKSRATFLISFPKPGFESWSKQLKTLENPQHLFNDTLQAGQIR